MTITPNKLSLISSIPREIVSDIIAYVPDNLKMVYDLAISNKNGVLKLSINESLKNKEIKINFSNGFENIKQLKAFFKHFGESVVNLDLSSLNVNDEILIDLISLTPNLKKLKCGSLINGNCFTDPNINLSHLEEISLSGCYQLTDKNLTVLLKKIPQIKKFDCSFTLIKGRCFQDPNVNLMHLEEINLSNCSDISEENFRALLQKTMHLKKIECRSTSVSGSVFCDPNVNLMWLEEIDLSCCSRLTEQNFTVLMQKKAQLKKIDCSSTKIAGTGFNDSDVNLKQLEEVNLSSCHSLTDENLTVLLQKAERLKKLDCIFTKINGDSFKDSKVNLMHLEEINLSSCNLLKDENLTALLQKAEQLKKIDCSSTKINGCSFADPNVNLTQLISIDLSKIANLIEENFKAFLLKASFLKNLYCSFRDSLIDPDIKLTHLEELDLLKSESLDDFKLVSLLQKTSQLKKLSLVSIETNGACLKDLELNFTHLEELELFDCHFTDEAIEVLLQKTNKLKKLNCVSSVITGSCFSSSDLNLMHIQELLIDSSSLIEDNLINLLSKTPQLKSLELVSMTITGSKLRDSSFNLSELEELKILDCEDLSRDSFEFITKKAPRLKNFLIN